MALPHLRWRLKAPSVPVAGLLEPRHDHVTPSIRTRYRHALGPPTASNFSKPWSCSALSRMLKISILMYDSILHNDTGVNSKVPLAYFPLKQEDCARARFRKPRMEHLLKTARDKVARGRTKSKHYFSPYV